MSVFWILTFVPTFVFHLALIAGAIGLLVSSFLGPYKLPVRIASFILFIGAVFFQGALAYKHSVALEVAELKLKLQKAETKSVETNTEIVEKIVTDTQVIREKGKTITEYVDREVTIYNDRCVLPKEVINAHNMAATLKLDEGTPEGEPK